MSLLKVNKNCKNCITKSQNHAGCFIVKDGKIFLVKDLASWKFGFVAGTHDEGEFSYQTAFRETLEESGLVVEIVDFINEFKDQNFDLFKCKVVEDKKVHDFEILEKGYFTKNEVLQKIAEGQARFPNQLQFVVDNWDKIVK